MILRFINPGSSSGAAKLTVHKTGKLGFSKGAMELLNTKKNRYVRFGFDEEDNLFLQAMEQNAEYTLPISKAGSYDYINAKAMLDELGIDYTAADTTIFDIRKTSEKGVYRLTQRVIKKARQHL